MKRIAATIVILMLGILPVIAESTSTQPIRGAAFDAMVREEFEWITQNTDYEPSGSPEFVFVESLRGDIRWNRGDGTPLERDLAGRYDPATKTVYLLNEWVGGTREDWETLVHELVHYAQAKSKRHYRCRADFELEATILSIEFLNDRFDNQWANLVLKLKSVRENELLCSPQPEAGAGD